MGIEILQRPKISITNATVTKNISVTLPCGDQKLSVAIQW